jgi:hypothetical protein
MKTALKPRLFVVIHTVTSSISGLDHAIEQSLIAKEQGANGIFIIPDYAKGHKLMATTQDQLFYVKMLREKVSDFLIGVNFLTSLSDIRSDICLVQPDLLQTDYSSLDGIGKEQLPNAEFFCGVAFKYSQKESVTGEKLREDCLSVASMCDVPTTSGRATGYSASIDKIKEISSYLPQGKRFGLASGVSIENVESYLSAGVTDFLVATSLVDHVDQLGRDILSPLKVRELSEKIHLYQ